MLRERYERNMWYESVEVDWDRQLYTAQKDYDTIMIHRCNPKSFSIIPKPHGDYSDSVRRAFVPECRSIDELDKKRKDRSILKAIDNLDQKGNDSSILNAIKTLDQKRKDSSILKAIDGLDKNRKGSSILKAIDGLEQNKKDSVILEAIDRPEHQQKDIAAQRRDSSVQEILKVVQEIQGRDGSERK